MNEGDAVAVREASEDAPRSGVRTCLVTREEKDLRQLLRFVLDPAGVVTPDLRRKLPGRGVWVSRRVDFVKEAVRKNLFERNFRIKAAIPENLAETIDKLMVVDCLQSLAMCNKAGLAVCGFAKIETAIGPDMAALLHASDGSLDGRRKLNHSFLRHFGVKMPPVVDFFASMQLDLAFGRTNVVHAAVKRGPASAAFLERCVRLREYRGIDAPSVEAA